MWHSSTVWLLSIQTWMNMKASIYISLSLNYHGYYHLCSNARVYNNTGVCTQYTMYMHSCASTLLHVCQYERSTVEKYTKHLTFQHAYLTTQYCVLIQIHSSTYRITFIRATDTPSKIKKIVQKALKSVAIILCIEYTCI